MNLLTLLSVDDVQQNLANFIKFKRKQRRLSRQALYLISTVPASTIKKFETTGQISLRQFLLLWQSIDDLEKVNKITVKSNPIPKSIDEVLKV